MPAPNRLVRSFSARLIWGSSTTRCPTSVASFFIQFNNPLLVYHIRRDTLHYFTKSSIILDIHFLVHYIRRDAPPYFTMSAHPG